MRDLLLDASIFSRAITSINISDLKKYMVQENKDVIVGNLTSMSGEIISYLNPNVVRARSRLPDGSTFKVMNQKKFGLETIEVPAGLTFEELIDSLEQDSLFPVIFPIYPKGTIGGFIATNGSGFGSYKYGFVRNKINLYELKDKDTAIILAAKYPELIELDQEVPYAWSGIIIDGKFKYYLPSSYSSVVHVKGSSVSTKSVIEEIFNISTQLLKKDHIPICLRSSDYNLLLNSPIERKIGYVINYNAPNKNYVICGSISNDEIGNLFNFLKNNPSVLPFPSLQQYTEMHKTIIDKYKKEIRIPKNLDKYKAEFLDASKCINCGICLDYCIAFKSSGNILYSPVGKFNRLITGETQFEYCLGCKEEEDYCPQEINISKLASEFLPTISSGKEKVSIQLEKASTRIKELEAKVESKYRNRPLFILFLGCAYKYDPLGVEGFLQFLLENGDNMTKYSPRVKIVEESCCGFDKYITGNVEGAKVDTSRILELKQRFNAAGIYFLCPEGLYVYNSLSGDRGVLGYELLKSYIKGKVHTGCWTRKLGIEGDDKECAGIFLTSYKDHSLPIKKKSDVLTICPFSTWKYSTKSVYSTFLKQSQQQQIEIPQVSDQVIVDLLTKSLIQAVTNSVDEIADKIINWVMGGKSYFIMLILPIIRKNFSIIVKEEFRKNEEIKNYFKSLNQNKLLLYDKISKLSYTLTSIEYRDLAADIANKTLTSSRLEYESRNIVESPEFKEAMNYVIKNVVKEKVLEDIVNDIIFI